MAAVEIKPNTNSVKIRLPNGCVVDVLSSVLNEIYKWIQNDGCKPESGGYIVGYQHGVTGNISLEAVSGPYEQDVKKRAYFSIKDVRHKNFLKKVRKRKSYYMGVWHTHPQSDPTPSIIDWKDWNKSLLLDRTGSQYMFFIIAGSNQWRIWIGDIQSGIITEGFECAKDIDGIYIK